MSFKSIQNVNAFNNPESCDMAGQDEDKLHKISNKEINGSLWSSNIEQEENIFSGTNIPDDITQFLAKMNPDNILNMLEFFKSKYGKNIENLIASESKIDKIQKEEILSKINKCLYKNKSWDKPNSKFNMKFNQNKVGDCFFISSLQAILSTEKGAEILDNIVTDNKDGTYKVKFKGTDKEYIVTALDILHSENFSDGDPDVKVLEIAANRHFFIGIKIGGNVGLTLSLLTGKKPAKSILKFLFKFKMESAEELIEIINNGNNAVVAGTTIMSWLKADKKSSYSRFILPQHAYSLVKVEGDYVYLRDPRFSNISSYKDRNHFNFKMQIEEFRRIFSDIQYVSLE